MRRHCLYIIISESETDSAAASKDLGTTIRKIRTDLGVEINLDVSKLAPGEDGLVEKQVAIGTVE